jgi:hypothetical protein
VTLDGEAARDEEDPFEVGVTALERIELERDRFDPVAGTPRPLDLRLCVCKEYKSTSFIVNAIDFTSSIFT